MSKEITRKDARRSTTPFTKEKADEWLWRQEDQPWLDEKFSSSAPSETGPEQLLAWSAVAGDAACYANQVVEEPLTTQKIIISNPFLAQDPKEFPGEFSLLSTLLDKQNRNAYEVYLWEGPETLSKGRPLRDLQDFFQRQGNIQAATEASVKAQFASQHRSTQGWTILDHASWEAHWGESGQVIDLYNFSLRSPEERKQVLAAVNPEEITEICLLAPKPSTLEFILNQFPKLHTLVLDSIPGVRGNLLDRYHKVLQESSVKFLELPTSTDPIFNGRNFYSQRNKKKSADASSVRQLNLLCETYRYRQLDSINRLTGFRFIYHFTPTTIKLVLYEEEVVPSEYHEAVKKLVMEDVKQYENFDFIPKDANLFPTAPKKNNYSISLHQEKPEVSDSKGLPSVQVEALVKSGESMSITDLEIRVINIEPFTSLLNGDNFPQLKRLKIQSDKGLCTEDETTFPFLSLNLPALESVHIDGSGSVPILVKSCPQLVQLIYLPQNNFSHCSIEFLRPLPTLKYLQLPHITSSLLDGCSQFCPALTHLNGAIGASSKTLNLEKYKALKTLELEIRGNRDTAIKTPAGLKILRVINNRHPSLSVKTSLNLEESTQLEFLYLRNEVEISGLAHCRHLLAVDAILSKEQRALLPQGCKIDDTYLSESDSEHKRENIRGISYFSAETALTSRAPRRPGEIAVAHASGELKGHLTHRDPSKGDIIVADYRIFCLNTLHYDEKSGQISFLPATRNITDQDFKPIPKPNEVTYQWDQRFDHSIVEGTLVVGKDYPLPTTGPISSLKDFHLVGEGAADIQVGYYHDPQTQQVFIRLLAPRTGSAKINLEYDFIPASEYHQMGVEESHLNFEPAEVKSRFFPSSLIEKVKDLIEQDQALQFLLNPQLPLKYKILKCRDFCRSFNEKTVLNTTAQPGSLDLLLDKIKHRYGSCLESSQAFMLLLLLFTDADVQMEGGETHAYVAIRTQSGALIRFDLSGGVLQEAPDAKTQRDPSQLKRIMLEQSHGVAPKLEAKALKMAATENGALIPLDLGGGDLQDIPDAETKHDPSQLKRIMPEQDPPIAPQLEEKKPPAAETESKDSARKRPKVNYEDKIRALLSERPVFDWKLLDDKQAPDSAKPILIQVPPGKDAVATARYQCFPQEHIPSPYLFINHPDDLKRLKTSYTIDDEGRRIKVKGPLQIILEQGGTLFIDWSHFTSKQRLHYQSLWGTPPQLNGQQIDKALKIVGFTTDAVLAPPTFVSQCRLCQLPPATHQQSLIAEVKTQEIVKPELLIDLQVPDWYSELMGPLTFSQGRYQRTEGPLLKAIENNWALTLHQPPNDPAFWRLFHQIKIEHRFWFNGKWMPVPEKVAQALQINDSPLPASKPTPDSKVAAIEWVTETEEKSKTINIHLSNWHLLFATRAIDENKISHQGPGYLEKSLKSSHRRVFYVTESIPEDRWKTLMATLQKQYPDKTFLFRAAPGVKIPDLPGMKQPSLDPSTETQALSFQTTVAPSELKQKLSEAHSLCFRSNDHAYLTQVLQDLVKSTDPVVIDATPDKGVAESLVHERLLEEDKPIAYGDEAPLRFEIEKKQLLEALEQGKTVIRKGPLPPRLMQALLPLFSKHPYLEYNGQRVPIKGRLILVLPESSPPFAPLPSLSCHWSSSDYRAALLAQSPPLSLEEQTQRTQHIDDLLLFFQAAEFEHRGSSMPTDLGMTYHRLSQMLRVLSQPHRPLHRHNPIKGLMLYHYQDYAFLNVLGKFLFDPTPGPGSMRVEKFQALCQEQAESKSQDLQQWSWRLLNTCDGPLLREILGKDWLKNAVKLKEQGPLLSCWNQSTWAPILAALQEKAKENPSQEKKESKVDLLDPTLLTKLDENLKYLIEIDPDATVITTIGDPGVGKTHFLNKTTGTTDFLVWLKVGGLFKWDEANMAQPGMMEILDGLHRSPPAIRYENTLYPLDKKHKILCAINPSGSPDRFFHRLLLESHTERARMPKPALMRAWLKLTDGLNEKVAEQIVAAIDLYKKHHPLGIYSYRNLQAIVQRYQALCWSGQNEQEALYQALYLEFVPLVAIDQQIPLKNELANLAEIQDPEWLRQDLPPLILKGRRFPREMTDAERALRQAFLTQQFIQEKSPDGTAIQTYQRGVILQSATPGIGKLTFTEALLQAEGYVPAESQEEQKEVPPSTQRYYKVTAGEGGENFNTIALKAFHEGAVLIIEKMHLIDKEQGQLLADLLMGIHKNQPAKRLGFLAIGLKYPSTEADSHSFPPALLNRMNPIDIPPLSNTSWEEVISHQRPDETAADFVQDFWHPQKPYPYPVSGHDLFHCWQKLSPPRVIQEPAPSAVELTSLSVPEAPTEWKQDNFLTITENPDPPSSPESTSDQSTNPEDEVKEPDQKKDRKNPTLTKTTVLPGAGALSAALLSIKWWIPAAPSVIEAMSADARGLIPLDIGGVVGAALLAGFVGYSLLRIYHAYPHHSSSIPSWVKGAVLAAVLAGPLMALEWTPVILQNLALSGGFNATVECDAAVVAVAALLGGLFAALGDRYEHNQQQSAQPRSPYASPLIAGALSGIFIGPIAAPELLPFLISGINQTNPPVEVSLLMGVLLATTALGILAGTLACAWNQAHGGQWTCFFKPKTLEKTITAPDFNLLFS